MDFLGNISTRLVGLVATILTLGAAYLFIVKPVLETTNDISNRAFDTAAPAIRQAQRAARRAERQQARGNAVSKRARRRANCILRASGDPDRIQACLRRFPL